MDAFSEGQKRIKIMPRERQMKIMHDVNQAIADNKIVVAGKYRIFGAAIIGDEVRFWYPASTPDHEYQSGTLPAMCARAFIEIETEIIRAFLPHKTGEEIIYSPEG